MEELTSSNKELMELASALSEKTVEQKQMLLVLLGYSIAEDEIYKIRRDNIVVLPVGQNLDNSTKGDVEIMKNIRKRKDGRWEARLKLNNKRISVYGKTQKECYNKLQKVKKANKNVSNSPQKNVTLFNFAKFWLNNFKKIEVKSSTFNLYENLINHMEELNNPLNSYKTSDLQLFLNTFGQTRIKELIYQLLKQIFKKALELDYIKKDVASFLTKGKIERIKKRSFTIDEQKKIMTNLKNNKLSRYILAYLLLGARLSELSSIKKANIKDEYLYIEGTKTKSAQRWVKISKRYQNILLSYDEPLFNWSSNTLKAKMRAFFQKLKIPGTTHMLRHTFSTNLYYLGADDNTRKQYLGHSSIVVTNDIYTHLDPTIKKEDIREIYGDLYPEF